MTGTGSNSLPINIIKAMRPNQWTKNAVLLAALVFGFWDSTQYIDLTQSLMRVIPALVMFCLASSGIYLINDVRDIKSDQGHPTKRFRPIAAGLVDAKTALTTASILLLAAGVGAWLLTPKFFLVLAGYALLQIVYTLLLKNTALVDVFVIAGGFVLRAIAGAVVIDVIISPWLLLCTFLLALFLALCKRRHEKIVIDANHAEQRASLANYDPQLLNQLIAITSSSTIVAYSIYTLWPETIEKFGTNLLGLTIPFVMFGIFRYLDLVYRHEKGDRPEKILLTDIPLLIDIALYGLAVITIFIVKA